MYDVAEAVLWPGADSGGARGRRARDVVYKRVVFKSVFNNAKYKSVVYKKSRRTRDLMWNAHELASTICDVHIYMHFDPAPQGAWISLTCPASVVCTFVIV